MAADDPRWKLAQMMSPFGILQRDLNAEERRIAKRVFGDTLPLSRISITNGIGLGGAPFTQPEMGLLNMLTLGEYQSFLVHVGPDGFFHGLQTHDRVGTLVHELVHVWQGWNGDGFFLSAGWCQLRALVTTGDRNTTYAYRAGEAWERYNVEQQAMIVEDWYMSGAVEGDALPLYPYIKILRDPIRRRFELHPFLPYHD